MVLVDAIILFFCLRIMCYGGEAIIFLLNMTLGTQTTSIKVNLLDMSKKGGETHLCGRT